MERRFSSKFFKQNGCGIIHVKTLCIIIEGNAPRISIEYLARANNESIYAMVLMTLLISHSFANQYCKLF